MELDMKPRDEGIRIFADPLSDASVRELYGNLVSAIVDHSERHHGGRSQDTLGEREATAFFAEVVVASGAIIADMLSRDGDRRQRAANIRSFQTLLTRMVEEKAECFAAGGRA
jgi:hypothetical protein